MTTGRALCTSLPDGGFPLRLRPAFSETFDQFLHTGGFPPGPDDEAPPLQAAARWEKPDDGHAKRPDWRDAFWTGWSLSLSKKPLPAVLPLVEPLLLWLDYARGVCLVPAQLPQLGGFHRAIDRWHRGDRQGPCPQTGSQWCR